MVLARKATVTTMSSKPCSFSSSTMCSIIGRLAIGIIGLGWFDVRGRRRVPSPPAMITAFTVRVLPRRGAGFSPFAQRLEGDRDVEDQRVPAEEEPGDGERPPQQLGG